jgi:hypothetical protein
MGRVGVDGGGRSCGVGRTFFLGEVYQRRFVGISVPCGLESGGDGESGPAARAPRWGGTAGKRWEAKGAVPGRCCGLVGVAEVIIATVASGRRPYLNPCCPVIFRGAQDGNISRLRPRTVVLPGNSFRSFIRVHRCPSVVKTIGWRAGRCPPLLLRPSGDADVIVATARR